MNTVITVNDLTALVINEFGVDRVSNITGKELTEIRKKYNVQLGEGGRPLIRPNEFMVKSEVFDISSVIPSDYTELISRLDATPASTPIKITPVVKPSKAVEMVSTVETSKKGIDVIENVESYIPKVDEKYVPFGHFKDLTTIFKSRIFYPVYITGMSGNGKTLGISQAAAKLKREIIRVNFTVETDEDDLMGGFRLVDGETVWHDGPVITAMKRGAILLLDEVDLAGSKVMALQSVLEGNGVFLKKIGKLVQPASGFTVVATGNTKGKGSDDGRFVGTNVMNEAFLDRFKATIEQPYPTEAIEKKILRLSLKSIAGVGALTDSAEEFIGKCAAWAGIIRKTFDEGGVDEIISTRRLVDVVSTYAIFNDRSKAIALCTSRFDDETQLTFRDLYSKLDSEVASPTEETSEEVPF